MPALRDLDLSAGKEQNGHMVEAATTSGLAQGEQYLADGDWAAATEAFESVLMIGTDPAAHDG